MNLNAALAGLVLLGTCAAVSVPPQANTISGYLETVGLEGISLKLDGDRWITLWGIDPVSNESCPKPFGGYWSCEMVAANRLYTMLRRDSTVTCEIKGTRGTVPVGTCSNREGDLARRLVAIGWARAAEAYKDEEEAAKEQKMGIWMWRQ